LHGEKENFEEYSLFLEFAELSFAILINFSARKWRACPRTTVIGLQNILRAEILAIHHTLFILNQEFPQELAHIFTDSLNSLYLINTQIKHPTQQNNHPDKTILALIVKLLKDRVSPTTLYKVRAHTNIIGNEEADKLAKEGSKIDLENDMPT
jgi:ribonuclease HI